MGKNLRENSQKSSETVSFSNFRTTALEENCKIFFEIIKLFFMERLPKIIKYINYFRSVYVYTYFRQFSETTKYIRRRIRNNEAAICRMLFIYCLIICRYEITHSCYVRYNV